MIARGLGSPYHPVCELTCLENTHNSSGGWVLPIDCLRQVGLAPPLHPDRSAVGRSPGIWPLRYAQWVPASGQTAVEGHVRSQAAQAQGIIASLGPLVPKLSPRAETPCPGTECRRAERAPGCEWEEGCSPVGLRGASLG